ncbi:MAG: aminotransferase class V-fold PLP-dependent enzyme [Patescibacteria group bacterium]|jgi:dTDP-4-amino-4,6-dideoxygalactose transaminase
MNLSFNHTKLKASKKKKEIIKHIGRVIDSGIFINGKSVQEAERRLKNYFGAKYFITCASGHDSLLLALQSLGLKKNDEIIFPVNAYPTAFPIFMNGLKGIPVDVDDNGQIDPILANKAITRRTKAIVMVHLYGLVGNLEKIIEICKKNKIFLIEDCAQSFGSRYQGKLVGTFGDIGCLSFYPTKNLGTLGDGGGILVKSKKQFNFLRKAVQYGEKHRYQSEFIAGHSRLPEIQATVLNLYLRKINEELLKRKLLAHYYLQQITKYGLNRYITVLISDKESDPMCHLFVIRAKMRDNLRNFLMKENIETFIHYPLNINRVCAFNFLSKNNYPNAEILSKEIISLPFHPYLKKKQINFIVKKIFKFYNKNH